LAGYPDAVREVTAQRRVALIDMNAMSKRLFEAMGSEDSMNAFMHSNSHGAYELARCVVHGLRQKTGNVVL
jgi:hypothetical protein